MWYNVQSINTISRINGFQLNNKQANIINLSTINLNIINKGKSIFFSIIEVKTTLIKVYPIANNISIIEIAV